MSITYKYHSIDHESPINIKNIPVAYFKKCSSSKDCVITETNTLESIETGKIVCKFVDNIYCKIFTVNDSLRKTYVTCTLKINDNCLEITTPISHSLPLIDFNVFVNIVKQIMQDGIVINFNLFKFNIVKTHKDNVDYYYTLNSYYPDRFPYIRVHNCFILPQLKDINLLDAGIVDANMVQIIKDEYKKHLIKKNINYVKNQIEDFLTTQTTFDDTTQFTQVLDALELI